MFQFKITSLWQNAVYALLASLRVEELCAAPIDLPLHMCGGRDMMNISDQQG